MTRKIPLLTLKANGDQPVFMEPTVDSEYRVVVGDKTLIGFIRRRGSLEWRVSRSFVRDDQLGSRLETEPSENRIFELPDDAAAELVLRFGYDVTRCQTTFREAVTHDLDLSPERKAELIAMCDTDDQDADAVLARAREQGVCGEP